MAMREDAGLDELLATAKGASPGTIAKIIAFARAAVAAEQAGATGLDEESRAWLNAGLTPSLEAEDWTDVPRSGKPIRWDSRRGTFVVVGGKDVG